MRALIPPLAISLAVTLTACLPTMEFQSTNVTDKGAIYLQLPEGITQGGADVALADDSSRYFAERLAYHIEAKTDFTVIVADDYLPDASHAEDKAAAQAAAKEHQAQYSMMVELGEYLDAGSMSFRADSLTVKSLRIYDVETGVLVFGLKRPYVKTTANLSKMNSVLDSLAKETGSNLAKHTK